MWWRLCTLGFLLVTAENNNFFFFFYSNGLSYATVHHFFGGNKPQVISSEATSYFVYFKLHFFLWGEWNWDIIFLHCDFRSLGPPTNVPSKLWKTEQGRRASVFVVDFIVDFTDLMMTSSQLPPTHAKPLLVYILSSPGVTVEHQTDWAVGSSCVSALLSAMCQK